MSEADVGGLAVQYESPYQYSITCCSHATGGSRGAIWQNGIWHESLYDAKVWKNCTHCHSLTFIECLWKPNSVYQHSEVHFSYGDSNVKDKSHSRWLHSCHTLKRRVCWSAHLSKSVDYREVLSSVCWWWAWQHCNIAKFTSDRSHKCSHRNRKNNVGKFVRTYWTNKKLEVAVSWVTYQHCDVVSSLWVWVKMTVHAVNSPLQKKFKTCPSAGKVMCIVFWGRKGVNLLDFLEPRETTNSDFYITVLTKLKVWTFRVRPEKNTIFLLQRDNTKPKAILKTMEHTANLDWAVLPHPPYIPELASSDIHLFGLMRDGQHG